MTFRIIPRWFGVGYRVFKQNDVDRSWLWVATFRTRTDADCYIMNLNGAERGA